MSPTQNPTVRISMRPILLYLLLAIGAPSAAAEPAHYARPELLIDASDLEQLLGDAPQVLRMKSAGDSRRNPPETLLDVRPMQAFRQGTIAAAHHVDVGEWKAAFGDGQDAHAWSARLGEVLLGADSTVIVFDDQLTPNAARAWWILKYWGIKDVRILNGGMQAWRQAGGMVSSPIARHTQTPIAATPHPERLATAQEVMECIGKDDNEVCLIDTRTTSEVQSGYIPTACHTDWQEYVDPATGKMRSAAELEKLLARARFDRARETVAYCQSGGRASVVAFAAELMGGEHVANYFGSWGEWSRLPSVPIAKPE
ncbi:MAG: sulfurtransferase [Planctomycetales bacterium]|nr:sulfurtransferase [Planctomycetales bacterium]